MPYPKDDKALKRWEDGITASVKANPAPWNSYDTTIKSVIDDYTQRLSDVTGYTAPDWRIVKSILWTETGAAIPDWSTAPMQIGVNGDPGLKELLTSQAGKIILPLNYQTVLTTANVPTNGTYNVMAGVGYMLKILAKFGYYYPLTPPTPLVPLPSPLVRLRRRCCRRLRLCRSLRRTLRQRPRPSTTNKQPTPPSASRSMALSAGGL